MPDLVPVDYAGRELFSTVANDFPNGLVFRIMPSLSERSDLSGALPLFDLYIVGAGQAGAGESISFPVSRHIAASGLVLMKKILI
jgi:hypothetical protein